MDLTLTQGAPVLLHLLQFSGTMALGLSTALAAQRRGRDVFGVAALALIAALGGGTLRDLLLASTLRDGAARGGAPRDGLPVFWMDEPSYLGAVAALALAGSLLVRARLLQRWTAFRWADAVGLAALGVAGTDLGLAHGAGPLNAVALGGLSSVGSSLLRDALLQRTPLLVRAEFHATAVLLGAALHVLFVHTPFGGAATFWISVGVILALRAFGMRGYAW
jgi:uncharacterized membrane protein YeiH